MEAGCSDPINQPTHALSCSTPKDGEGQPQATLTVQYMFESLLAIGTTSCYIPSSSKLL